MAAPNIEMIAASLRSCSLGGGGGGDQSPPRPPPPHLAEATDESAGGITVELNSDTALPYHWEQCLDMRTGEIYYINRETGVRTAEDPRTAAASSSAYSSSYYCDGDGTSDEYSCSRVGSEDVDYEEEEEEDDGDTADSSTLSCTSPPESSANEEPGGQILVAAGCKACFMYFMVPKRVDACPKCGGGLLHLGRNGCV
ncbi:protein CURLY FLAG LEAF 1 [Musa acuminata AAA Group]|uniref:protein CURLY FLAG LEAF 1 n=1 Tax=Musa acuminata AAA Group TaxID=214697 RepID=UPI0031D358EB